MDGYIYFRKHQSYDILNLVKMGKAINLPDRDSVYATSEIFRGFFEIAYKVSKKQLNLIDNLLKYEFKQYNVRYNGGTEFFNKIVMDKIEDILTKYGITYVKLQKNEIQQLLRTYRIKKCLNSINKNKLIDYLKQKRNKIFPRYEQQIIINESVKYFENNDKGLLILPCGVGKTKISLWIMELLNSEKILIGVPNILLLKQWYSIIKQSYPMINVLLVFNTIDIREIKYFTNKYNRYIIITTYASSHKILSSELNVCIKINDEAHHLTSTNSVSFENKYTAMLLINSKKQLSLTATIKEIEGKNVISNNNINYFGNIIVKKNLLWAIKLNIVCDYIIQTIIADENQINYNKNKNLFLSAYCALKSIYCGDSHHILIYSNNMHNSKEIIKCIKIMLEKQFFNITELYYSNYSSDMNALQQKNTIEQYKQSKFGIISCVYCLGEGYDDNNIDCVIFSENMSSNIRIVQSALRASRKNINQPNKITKIILPILNINNLLEDDNNDFKKILQVIYQMSQEDNTIVQKICAMNINIKKYNYDKNEINIKIGSYNKEQTKNIILKSIPRELINVSYEKAKQIIKKFEIKSKSEYYDLCEKNAQLPKNPEHFYNNSFINWFDYLSILSLYYNINECKIKIKEYIDNNDEIKKKLMNIIDIRDTLCDIDPMFPPKDLWLEYYNVENLYDIINVNINKKIKITRII